MHACNGHCHCQSVMQGLAALAQACVEFTEHVSVLVTARRLHLWKEWLSWSTMETSRVCQMCVTRATGTACGWSLSCAGALMLRWLSTTCTSRPACRPPFRATWLLWWTRPLRPSASSSSWSTSWTSGQCEHCCSWCLGHLCLRAKQNLTCLQ